jgi:hypothetical protein
VNNNHSQHININNNQTLMINALFFYTKILSTTRRIIINNNNINVGVSSPTVARNGPRRLGGLSLRLHMFIS